MSTDQTQSQGAAPSEAPSNPGGTNTGTRQAASGGGRQRRSNRRSGTRVRTNTSAFKGATTDMNGHVFRCSTEGSDRKEFAKTLEIAALYANVHISEAQDIVSIFTSKDFDMPIIDRPKKTTLTEEQEKDKAEVAFVDALYKEQIRRYAT